MSCGCPFLPHFCGRLPSFIALSVKFRTFSHFPLRAYIYARMSLCFHQIVTSFCFHHFVYVTLLCHFVYVTMFIAPAYNAGIGFAILSSVHYVRIPPDNGSVSAADNVVYARQIYMPSPCFSVKFLTLLPFSPSVKWRCTSTCLSPCAHTEEHWCPVFAASNREYMCNRLVLKVSHPAEIRSDDY